MASTFDSARPDILAPDRTAQILERLREAQDEIGLLKRRIEEAAQDERASQLTNTRRSTRRR